VTNEELKEALMSECEVKHKGIIYKCVSAIIYRKRNGKVDVSAELTDKKQNKSVSIADPKFIEFAGGD
jgi:hypothetical protein